MFACSNVASGEINALKLYVLTFPNLQAQVLYVCIYLYIYEKCNTSFPTCYAYSEKAYRGIKPVLYIHNGRLLLENINI